MDHSGVAESFEETRDDRRVDRIAAHPVSACAFLTSISDVEMFGAKWIVAVPHRYWNEDLHEHALDELRHAKYAQDVARGLRANLDDSDIVREARLSQTFQRATDQYLSALSMRSFRPVRRKLGEDWYEPAYVLLSFLIERRLMKIYPRIARFGVSEDMRAMARQLIADERKHLSLLNTKLASRLELSGSKRDAIVELEETLAEEWIGKIADATELV